MVVYWNGRSYCGPISMVRLLLNGTLVVVFREADWEGVVRHEDPSTRTSLIRSTDGGRTWSDPIRPDSHGGNGTTINQFADGMILVSNYRITVVPVQQRDELKDRRVVCDMPGHNMVRSLDGTFCTRSFDNGASWEEPRPVRIPGYEDATTAGRVIELDDRSLLMPMNSFRWHGADQIRHLVGTRWTLA